MSWKPLYVEKPQIPTDHWMTTEYLQDATQKRQAWLQNGLEDC